MQMLILKFCLLYSGIFWDSSFYSIHITTINGVEKTMQDFSGKKIMVVVLPVTQNPDDSAFLRSVDSLGVAYPNVAIIAVPAFEDGYDITNASVLQNFYQGLLGSEITITRGMYTRKGAAQNQHELFSWLTHKEKNIHFDTDVLGAGQKFFINEQGDLYAKIDPGASQRLHLMQRMVQ